MTDPTLGFEAGWLTYPGDVRNIVGEEKGPDTDWNIYRAVQADYDETMNKTRVLFHYVIHPLD